MKFQFMLCLTIATSISTVHSELIVMDLKDEVKQKVYEDILSFSIPTLTSKDVRDRFRGKYNYNLVKTFGTEAAENNFKEKEISKIEPEAKLWDIPKSLYQLMVYDYLATLIDKPFAETYYKLKELFEVEGYTQYNEEYGITKACDRLMQNKKIQDIFWKVNDHATELYNKFSGDIEKITNHLLDNFSAKIEANVPKNIRPIDITNILIKKDLKKIPTLVGLEGNGPDIKNWKEPKDWDDKKRELLKQYVTQLILYENNISEYVIYRGDCYPENKKQLDPKTAYRRSLCFSDGLFSGFIFDQGASAFAISGKYDKSRLYVLKLDREKLLTGQYPIFIPPINALAAAAGSGELFHIRSKVIQAVKSGDNISKGELSIQFVCGKIKAGYLPTQTPELFMKDNPQILEERIEKGKFVYTETSQDELDQDGALKINKMIANIKEIDAEGKIVS